MERHEYEDYLRSFHARDYAAVSARFAADGQVIFADTRLSGRDAIVEFYAFFHQFVDETITVHEFAGTDTFAAVEATVRLEARADFDPAIAADRGYAGLHPLQKDAVVLLPQFIHYHLKDGMITSVVCLANPTSAHVPAMGDLWSCWVALH